MNGTMLTLTCLSNNVLLYWHRLSPLSKSFWNWATAYSRWSKCENPWVPSVLCISQSCSTSHSVPKWWNRSPLSTLCLVAQELWTVRLWGSLRFSWLLCTDFPEHQHGYKHKGYPANICSLLDRDKGLRASNFLFVFLSRYPLNACWGD